MIYVCAYEQTVLIVIVIISSLHIDKFKTSPSDKTAYQKGNVQRTSLRLLRHALLF